MLFSLNGVPALEDTTKTGYMFILDRASGEPLFPYQEVAVPPTPANAAFQIPWPTQPVSSIESLTEQQVEPGRSRPVSRCSDVDYAGTNATWCSNHMVGGGMEWPPAAYSPRTHMFYSHARYSPTDVGQRMTRRIQRLPAGQRHVRCGVVRQF